MRLLFISALLCLTLCFSTAQAQTSSINRATNGSVPPIASPARFTASDIDQKMVKEFDAAWRQCVLGTKSFEAIVLILRDSDGTVRAVLGGRTNQAYEFTFKWNPAIIALVHTHPNNRDPKPQGQDILVARRFDIPIFTITRSGMYIYDPASEQITKVHSGTDWLEPSCWTRKFHSGVDRELARR